MRSEKRRHEVDTTDADESHIGGNERLMQSRLQLLLLLRKLLKKLLR